MLAKRTTVYRSADKGLGPTIHHDPRLSTCHFRFAWRARRINYRDPSTTGYFLTPESLSCRQFNVPLCSFLIQLFLFLKLISIRRSSDLIIRRGNPFSRNTFVLYIYIYLVHGTMRDRRKSRLRLLSSYINGETIFLRTYERSMRIFIICSAILQFSF